MNAPAKSASGARRLLLRFALLTVLVVAAVFTAMERPRPSAITRDNEAGPHEGMTVDELVAILGGPPRDESTGPTDYDPDGLTHMLGRPAPPTVTNIDEWISDEVLIRVAFDADGRAEWISTCPLRRTHPGIQPTVEHWLFKMEKRLR